MGQCLGVQAAQQQNDAAPQATAATVDGGTNGSAATAAKGALAPSAVQPILSSQPQAAVPPDQEQPQQQAHKPQQASQQDHVRQQQQPVERQQQQKQLPQQQQQSLQEAQHLPTTRQKDQTSSQTEVAEPNRSHEAGSRGADAACQPTSSPQREGNGTSEQLATSGTPVQSQGLHARLQNSTSSKRGTVELLRAQKSQRLRDRRSLTNSFKSLQLAVSSDVTPTPVITRAAGLKHIGFGPLKRENQDEFFIQVEDFGGADDANLFCVFDGHGTYGKDAAAYSRQQLPVLLDAEMRKYFNKVSNPEDGLKGAVEVLLSEVFGETERSLQKAGININSSGTTASVAYQKGNRLWVASAGDSRVILCCKDKDQVWRVQALTIDHRPRRPSERARVEASGGRVAPKRLPSGRTVGEPRLWLADVPSPGLLLSRSLGDMTAATVGCTSDPEITYLTLRPHMDCYMVLASDGVWDVLTNDQVCEIVVASPDPHIACRRVLDAALFEWEERMSADNITVIVAEFDWNASSRDADSGSVREQGTTQNGNGSSQPLPDDGQESHEDEGDAVHPLRSVHQRRQLRGR